MADGLVGWSDLYGGPNEFIVNSDGYIYTFPLSSTFDITSTNVTGLLGRISRTGSSSSSNIAPNFFDGTMFYNNDVLMTYGCVEQPTLLKYPNGNLQLTNIINSGLIPDNSDADPSANDLIAYEAFQYGPPKTAFEPGSVLYSTGGQVSRYVTNGAGASVPSDKFGYYFGGMRRHDWGPIRFASSHQANESTNKFITVDMSEWREPKFTNVTLPRNVPSRSGGELVWIPVSGGALINIGGATNPESVFSGRMMSDSLQEENREKDGAFMKSVEVYDIQAATWYPQNTTGDAPPALSSFCSVMAAAPDNSSFNIYIYGGYDAIDRESIPYDHVYVLSIPSFRWIKIADGERKFARRGHKCIKAYPDQMLVYGGVFTNVNQCLEGGFIRVYNLNTLQFQDTYNPEKWSEYKVPKIISDKIGGDENGGATELKPTRWGNDSLEILFSKKYPKDIETFYPYKSTSTSAPPPESSGPAGRPNGNGGTFPTWVGAVLGVVLGLIFITGLAVLWLICRRRREKRQPPSVGGTSEVARNRVLGWMYSQNHKTNMTVTSTEIGINDKHSAAGPFSDAGVDSVRSPRAPSTAIYSDLNAPEAAGSPIHEIGGGTRVPTGKTVMKPAELPTPYNETPLHRHPESTHFISPISPAVSPSPDNQMEGYINNGHPTRPTHTRHQSSISSTGLPMTLDHTLAGDNTESRNQHRRVSEFTENFSDTQSEYRDDPDPIGKIG
ncbi:hypothetical protein FQN57_000192 [Myotisia sp. PD_48]|nr:hypothetical protein FQN57_000192 [Myotisia sp. PD_48]